MSGDDELAELLGQALDDDAPAAPPPDRIAALRARAVAAHDRRTMPRMPGAIAPTWPPPIPVVAQSGQATHRHDRSSRWLAVAAVVIAVAGGLGVGRVLDHGGDRVAGDVEFQGPMNGADDLPADAELTVTATGIGRIVDLRTDVLPILPAGALYEVWFVATDDAPGTPHRISAGTFHPDPDGRSDVRFAAAVNPQVYPIVEITAEPGDGNPQAAGAVVLRAKIPTQP